MEIAKEIKKLAIDKGIMMKDIAPALGKSMSGFSHSMKMDDFRVSELEKIATALGCRVEINFVDID